MMSYGSYLRLDKILDAQEPLSQAHGELLFIIQHQTSELWMKLAIHELGAACRQIAADELRSACRTFSRVARIQEQLNSAWDVLRTLTPSDYAAFRAELRQSSGVESHQYRMLEYIAGNKAPAPRGLAEQDPVAYARLEAVRRSPSVYDEAIRAPARSGFAIDPIALQSGISSRPPPDESVLAAWVSVYREPDRHPDFYELAEKLVDFEGHFRRWRFNHMTTVERVIGFKQGTAGTAGVPFLRQRLDVVLFPELWQARSEL
ncbi:tryptophan 2,3-dioxygenase [Inquilinus sp. Marseille-Q2685]|uniref:tryptophan 2,3-dioxygenase n=1 Tax=Inquilinus sp. Marseille-Q2685 TaxID=2866581 RepID=UPI001CE49E6D|nr:tryptophan 2,3-dioxygenase family protein [Inquilinus sp. Marseille-Q2685]